MFYPIWPNIGFNFDHSKQVFRFRLPLVTKLTWYLQKNQLVKN